MSAENEDYPTEIIEKLQNFHRSFEKMEEILQPLISNNINSPDIKMTPLDRARLNLTSGYALNSLFCMYLNILGEDPKEHGIKAELDKYKSHMQRVKEISDKDKAPSLDKGAAKRFVRNALWEHSEKSNSQPTNKRTVGPTNESKKKKFKH